MQNLRWYTYILIDPRTGLPFYVGKGTGKRMYKHEVRAHNRRLRERCEEIKAAGLKIIYEKWFESDDENACYEEEKTLIASIGRKNLCNSTPGGGGPPSGQNSGPNHYLFGKKQSAATLAKRFPKDRPPYHLGWKHLSEAKRRVALAHLGKRRPRTELEQRIDIFENEGGYIPPAYLDKRGWRNPFFGKKHSQEVCNAMKGNTHGRANKGRTYSEETRQKYRLAKLGKKLGPFSQEHRARMSAAKQGSKNGMFGKRRLRGSY